MDSLTTHTDPEWRIGCSGFHYPDWKDIFYPQGLAQKKWFNYYCQHFNTLELNTTFYRFPQLKFMQSWHEQSPADFKFSVKVPRLITHYKQFRDTERMLNDFYNTTRDGLGGKLGCILFQLPSRTVYREEMLDRIMEQIDPAFTNVVEFRHESWWNGGVMKRLAAANISFCGHSYPGLPDELVCNAGVVYYRFHGIPKLYYSQYKRAFVERVVNELRDCGGVRQAYMYFNNTATVGALRNARYMQRLVGLENKKPS
ncbi:MAG TPA: DUF72 domain-containing protein [Chitinophagaceae bacterium]|nr:DUF72 domain-containing protein [Chitinophagaceae bacterium]